MLFAWMVIFGGLFEPDLHEVSIAVAGDVKLSHNIPTLLNGTGSAFKGVSNVTSTADMFLFNFENALTYSDNAVKKNGPLKCQPRFIDRVKGNDNIVVALANDHVCDYGIGGMRDTIQVLNDAGISHLGAGEDENQSHQNLTQKINGRTITVFNYMDSSNFANYSQDEVPYASGLAAGCSAYNSNVAQKQISEAKANGDFIIVYMHFGTEYSNAPNDDQNRIAHELIAYGADVVVGSNPHVPQGVEMYNGRPIFYSLGDFVSDSELETTLDTYFVKIDLVGDSCECTLYPVHLKDCVPYYSEPKDGSDLLASLSPQCYDMQIINGVGSIKFNLTEGD